MSTSTRDAFKDSTITGAPKKEPAIVAPPPKIPVNAKEIPVNYRHVSSKPNEHLIAMLQKNGIHLGPAPQMDDLKKDLTEHIAKEVQLKDLNINDQIDSRINNKVDLAAFELRIMQEVDKRLQGLSTPKLKEQTPVITEELKKTNISSAGGAPPKAYVYKNGKLF